jgi:hypothetical protein
MITAHFSFVMVFPRRSWRCQYIPAPKLRLRSGLGAKMKIPAETLPVQKLRLSCAFSSMMGGTQYALVKPQSSRCPVPRFNHSEIKTAGKPATGLGSGGRG